MMLLTENPYPRIESGLPTDDWCYSQYDLAKAFDEGAKAQLKKVVDKLEKCDGDLVSRNNGPFMATFEMLLTDYESLLKECREGRTIKNPPKPRPTSMRLEGVRE